MISGISVDSSGRLRSISFRESDFTHVHFSFEDIEIRSALSTTELSENTLHPFSFPPPFNTYLVPSDAVFVSNMCSSGLRERMHRLVEEATAMWKTRVTKRTDTGPAMISIRKEQDVGNDDSDEDVMDEWSDQGRDEEDEDDIDAEPEPQDAEPDEDGEEADVAEDLEAADDGDDLMQE